MTAVTRRYAISTGLAAAAAMLHPPTHRPDDERELRPARRIAIPPTGPRWESRLIGASALGRPSTMLHSPSLSATSRRVRVVAAIHGNEPITCPIAEAITATALPDDITLSVIPTMNPDGVAANTRRNAEGVDLNRNFPWRWSRADGGPGPASAPEVRAVMSVVDAGNFDFAVWIHQPLDYVAILPGCPQVYADT